MLSVGVPFWVIFIFLANFYIWKWISASAASHKIVKPLGIVHAEGKCCVHRFGFSVPKVVPSLGIWSFYRVVTECLHSLRMSICPRVAKGGRECGQATHLWVHTKTLHAMSPYYCTSYTSRFSMFCFEPRIRNKRYAGTQKSETWSITLWSLRLASIPKINSAVCYLHEIASYDLRATQSISGTEILVPCDTDRSDKIFKLGTKFDIWYPKLCTH